MAPQRTRAGKESGLRTFLTRRQLVLGPCLHLVILFGLATLLILAFAGLARGVRTAGIAGTIASLHYEVRLSTPETDLLHVRADVPDGLIAGRSYLDLTFRDLRERPEGLRSVVARLDGRPVVVSQPSGMGGHQRRIDVGNRPGPLTVEYTIDPSYYPPGREVVDAADAVSRVSSALAVLRTTAIFPIIDGPDLAIHVTFGLPPDWIAVVPWDAEQDGFVFSSRELAGVEYLGLGRFQVQEVAAGDVVMRIAMLRGETEITPQIAVALLRSELELLGAAPPEGGKVRTAVVVPVAFMRGGAAGARSIVQAPSARVLAHEMLHWWNTSILVHPEAAWFQEGFTEYYALKVAQQSGIILREEAESCLADLRGEMQYLELNGSWGLADVSRLAQNNRARRLVYSKGALFALLLDRQLQDRGRSLDEAWRTILVGKRQGLGNADLRSAFHSVYGGLVDADFNAYVTRSRALPDQNLGQATGRSGCARYLPR